MKVPRSRQTTWFRLRWPNEVTPEHLLAALSALNGSATPRRRESLVLLASGHAGHVTHHLAAPASRSDGVRGQLEAAIPALAVEPVEARPAVLAQRVWRAWISTNVRPLDTKHPETTARGLLSALASAGDHELLVLRWVLGPVRRPAAIDRQKRTDQGIGLPDWALDLAHRPAEIDPGARVAQEHKQGKAGWRAALHLGVSADGRGRQRQLLGRLAGAVRVSQDAGAQLGFRPTTRTAMGTSRLPLTRPLLVNVEELRGLAGWPLGSTEDLPIDRQRSRLLRPSRIRTTGGRVVAEATYPGSQRPLTLTAQDALQHLHVLGPTGTGKSTLLLNLIGQDMAAGRSVVVIEPRGDLVAEVLARVPDDRIDDVVVIDPTDRAPVGVNPLANRGMPGELQADHLLVIFKRLFAESWGPRTQDILTAGLLTLAATPGLSLVALPLLFVDADFRRELSGRVRDPFALDPFWDWFESLSPGERAHVTAPVMNKLRAFLLRPRLRRVIGQFRPRFDLRDIYRGRRIVLVNLATGTLGPESAALLGSLVVSQLWQTVLGRSAVSAAKRHPVMVFMDEFQHYLHLPTDLADVLAQARGLGMGLTLAHQHLGQLQSDVKAAVLANARSRVVFTTNHDDASVLVRGIERLAPSDLVNLGKYAVYASLLADSETTAYASGLTAPPPAPIRDDEEVRARSRHRWGVPAGVIDAELEAMVIAATSANNTAEGPDKRDGIAPRPEQQRRAS